MIKVEGIHKKFGKLEVLKGIDLDVDKPGITAILGPNGSGKTTLIKSILGLVIPDKGYIKVSEQDIKDKYLYRNKIAHLPQIARFPDNLTAHELLGMIKDLRGEKANDLELISLFGLGGELKKRMNTLSGGNRQKVNLVLSLMFDSPLIILDEPSTGLDPLATINLKNYLAAEKERGKQILITTHIISFVEEIADHIVFILDGKIYFNGSMKDLIKKEGEQKLEMAIAKILREHVENI
jgi:Cu-processing system ATP-binding protein